MQNLRIRRPLVFAFATGVLLALTPPSFAQRTPRLSGTIVSGVLTTGPAMPCEFQVDCLPWLQSGCRPALANRKDAWLTAIVNVRPLADGVTARKMVIRRGSAAGRILGGVHVQFWRADCREVRWASWHSFWDCSTSSHSTRREHGRPCDKTWSGPVGALESVSTQMPVPTDARWMTISANDNLHIRWRLA